jgi:choline kinase
VLGRPLIDYTIEAFVKAGFTRLGVVTGFQGHLLRDYLDDGRRYGLRIQCLPNAQHSRGNASSILASQSFVQDEAFVVSMADHMISPAILKRLLACVGSGHTLCVDRHAHAPPQINDATKVWVDERGFVAHIGKGLTKWNAIDVGVFLFTPGIFHHITACLHNGVCSITRTIRWMIACGDTLRTCDVSGAFWLDVDTPDDLRYACAVLRRRVSASTLRRSRYAHGDIGPATSRGRHIGSSAGVRRASRAPSIAGPADARLAKDSPDRSSPGAAGRRIGCW